jgi:hypothetical protein
MRRLLNPLLMMAVVLCGASVMMPFPTQAASDEWLPALTAMVEQHRYFSAAEGRAAAYEPYLAQLDRARSALSRGETEAVYAAMNRFMDMLEHAPEAAGIPLWSAKALFDFCGEVTPPMYHDVSRHGAHEGV